MKSNASALWIGGVDSLSLQYTWREVVTGRVSGEQPPTPRPVEPIQIIAGAISSETLRVCRT